MKRWIAVLLVTVFLSGCGASDDSMDRALALRQRIQGADGCAFDVTVTSDYGDYLHTFVLRCQWTDEELEFTVLAPDSIAGITGTISGNGGALTFDDSVLAFEPLADGQIAPVTAPWLLLKALESGYITSCTQSDGILSLSINDSYREDAAQLNIWLNADDLPSQAEVIWQGRRILAMQVENFQFS